MDEIRYSVIIRTLGTAGERYQALLDSISDQSIKPAEIIVVLPRGYELPKEQLGWETFVFSEKGMVEQRLAGIRSCKTPYALVCDDDLRLSKDFAERLYRPLGEGVASFSVAPLYSFLPTKGANAALCTVMGSAAPTLLHRRDRYITVLKSSGYSYNRHLKAEENLYYETQSAPWTCFFADVSAFLALELEKETWLDAHGYSALDDQTMFYKAWLMGFKTVVVADAVYEHLDAKASTRNNKMNAVYSLSFNRIVFWHRFIFLRQKRLLAKLTSIPAFLYRMLWGRLWDVFSAALGKIGREECKISGKGYADGWRYIRSKAYKDLPEITTCGADGRKTKQ